MKEVEDGPAMLGAATGGAALRREHSFSRQVRSAVEVLLLNSAAAASSQLARAGIRAAFITYDTCCLI